MSQRPAGALQELRRAREASVLQLLAAHGPMSRLELHSQSGLSRSAVFEIVSELLDQGVLVEDDAAATGQRGRPAKRVMVNPAAGLYLGVELGRGRSRWAFINAAHVAVATGESAAAPSTGWMVRLERALDGVQATAAERGVDLTHLRGAVLGLAGFVNDPRFPESDQLLDKASRLRARMESVLGTTVQVENNTRLAALAEVSYGPAAVSGDVLYLRLSEGVSMGVVSGGRHVRGAHNTAGEFGHVSVDPAGPPCHCGGVGCVEQYLGLGGLARTVRERGGSCRDGAALLQLLRRRDPLAVDALRQAVQLSMPMLQSVIAVLDPRRVIVGGELSEFDELVLEPIRAAAATVLPRAPRRLEVVPASLGALSAALGAATLFARVSDSGSAHSS